MSTNGENTATLKRASDKARRDTIMSVVVLAVIAFVCVALLAFANEYLKYEAKLDAATAGLINRIAPSGTDDATAFSEGYFKLYNDDELAGMNFSIKDFNSGRTVNDGKVSAVYGVVKGESAGVIVIETTSKGYYDMTMLVAVRDGAIVSAVGKSVNEDDFTGQIFKPERFDLLMAELAGKSEVPDETEIKVTTGATTSHSVRGLHAALKTALEAAQKINGGGAQ